MNWVNVLKSGEKEFLIEKKQEKKEIVIEKEDINIFVNPDEEFEYKYNTNMSEIKIAFEEYIRENGLPFLDNLNNTNYNIYDYMKEHSIEYSKLYNVIEIENKCIQKVFEEEQKELEKELEEELELD